MQKTSGAATQKKTSQEKILLQALAGEVTPRVPFWLMRQAGRYLPEYQALRKEAGSFMGLCFNPKMATEVTLQPVRRFGMDAAILFSDILVIPYALGQGLDFVEGEGPRLGAFEGFNGFREINFTAFDEKLQPVYETVRSTRKELEADKALIGFAGGPWTVACYMVQGQGDSEFNQAKKLAFSRPQEFDVLISTLVNATSRYLLGQIRHGADVVQIFDSWAGLLPEPYFTRWVIQPTREIVSNIRKAHPDFPVIGFPRRAGDLYKPYAEKSGVSCVGLDQYFPVEKAAALFGSAAALQGNLDPVFLLTGGKPLEDEVARILAATKNTPFIFNLGHGVIKETPPENVSTLAEILKAYRR